MGRGEENWRIQKRKGGEKKRGMWASVNGGEWETKGKVVGVILLLEPVALTLTVA